MSKYKEIQSTTKTKIESYPVPTQLATKTDLSPQETKEITEVVNPKIANITYIHECSQNITFFNQAALAKI